MAARIVNLNAIPPQFNFLPFQIPPFTPPDYNYKTFLSEIYTIPANTTFLNETITIPDGQFTTAGLGKVMISSRVIDSIDFNGALPFGLSTWVIDNATDIIVSFWNETAADIDIRLQILHFIL